MEIGTDFIGLQMMVHYFLHLVFPFGIAWIFFRKNWVKAGLIMALTIFVDLDHLLANPVFDPLRCSINFHPLHSYWAMGVYVAGVFYKKTRWIAIGLILHMLTDFIDCLWIFKNCHECFVNSSIHELALKLKL
jgi:hypothetical protein